jgi:hypothetical protein
MLRIIKRYLLMLTLLSYAGSVSAIVTVTLPKAQAKHFCQLLINDGNSIAPLHYHARNLMTQEDSLTAEQLFAGYIFFQDNWKTMRFFPHTGEDGTVTWYAPTDQLPSTLSPEHQKYIREVFPRLSNEIQAGNWETVDAYIDKMIEYQCKYGGGEAADTIEPSHLIGMIVLFLIGLVVISFFIRNFAAKITKQ